MPESSNRVRLQVLLRGACRNEKGRAEAIAALTALGLEVTGTGAASISVRASPAEYSALFGPGSKGTRGADVPDSGREIVVPSSLADTVEQITVAPRHIQMSGDANAHGMPDKDEETR